MGKICSLSGSTNSAKSEHVRGVGLPVHTSRTIVRLWSSFIYPLKSSSLSDSSISDITEDVIWITRKSTRLTIRHFISNKVTAINCCKMCLCQLNGEHACHIIAFFTCGRINASNTKIVKITRQLPGENQINPMYEYVSQPVQSACEYKT